MERISRDELKRKIDEEEDFTLVEVLPPKAYREFHLPSAINVPVGGDFDDDIRAAVPDKSEPIVVYCTDSECDASPSAAERLDELGYQKVYDYAEGKMDWKGAGLPIESEA